VTLLKYEHFLAMQERIKDENRLLIFRGLAHYTQRILAAVRWLALVSIERRVNFLLCVILGGLARLELGVATFANADGRKGRLYDPQFALLHDCSLAHRKEGA
jgi:hypothetical protein